ncbi:ATP cone domain-containing protein [Clostridium sp.]|uniref:ATP cone domain-containing protein n=1 Tax=Clostridium sp. TaxID=1506 RepID=UPI003F67B819
MNKCGDIMEIKVLKRNFQIEKLEEDKIQTSIRNTGIDIGLWLSSKEIKIITKAVFKKIKEIATKKNEENEYIVSIFEIRGIVIDTLIKLRYIKVAEAYINSLF